MRQKETAVIPIPRRMVITAVLHFQSRQCKLPFAVCICACEENVGLQREYSLCRWVSNRGASRPVGTRFCSAKSSVLYLCFRLTRKRGWRRTLRCGRVWRQTLFRGSRTGGFCDVGYGTNAGFLRNKIRLAGKGSEGIYSPRLAAALRAKTTTAAPARGCPSPRPPASLPCSR